MIFVDTGAWFAALVPADRRHAEASAWVATNSEPLVTTDYIVDETLTLLRARGEHRRVAQAGDLFFEEKLATLEFVTPDDIRAAFRVMKRYADKDWSFTDCTSLVVMERLGIGMAFTFDLHFRQFGTVKVVP